MAEHVIEALSEREVRPVVRDPDELYPVAPVGRRGVGESRLEQPHRRVARILAECIELVGRQRR
jgi:hypothetical protein